MGRGKKYFSSSTSKPEGALNRFFFTFLPPKKECRYVGTYIVFACLPPQRTDEIMSTTHLRFPTVIKPHIDLPVATFFEVSLCSDACCEILCTYLTYLPINVQFAWYFYQSNQHCYKIFNCIIMYPVSINILSGKCSICANEIYLHNVK